MYFLTLGLTALFPYEEDKICADQQKLCVRDGIMCTVFQIWITAFIYPFLFFCFTFVEHSCGLGNVITDDVNKIHILKGNIPNDYIIKVRYVPQSEELNDICWLMLNIYELQLSLTSLAVKFAETSSNKENITILIDMVTKMRRPFEYEEEDVIGDYHCHYQDGNFNTSVYFDYFKKIIETYELHERQFISPDCMSPPCPTSETTTLVAGSITNSTELLIMTTTACVSASDCSTQETRHGKNREAKTNTQGAEQLHIPLYLLLLIPVFGILLVLTWKHTKKRRMNTQAIHENETLNVQDNVNQEGPAEEMVTLQAVVEL